jgi:predicted dehydrogenase
MSGKVFHAPFLHAHPGFELSAVLERSTQKAAETYPDIRSFATLDELLADPSIELVVVTTPNNTHFEYGMKALQAGKHVLMEKPFATSVEEAKTLFDEAKKRNLCLLPYQNRRYDTDYLSVKEVLDSGVLGKLTEVHIRFDRYRPEIGPKKFKETRVPGSGLLFDLGPHLLDQVLATFGEPVEWRKTLGYNRPETVVDDFMQVHLTYPEGLNIFVSANMMVVDVQPAYILHGSKGSYVKRRTDVQEKQLVGGWKPSDAAYGLEEPGSEGLLNVVDEEGRCIRSSTGLKQSSYLGLFEAVHQTVRMGKPYFVSEQQVLKQLEIMCISV